MENQKEKHMKHALEALGPFQGLGYIGINKDLYNSRMQNQMVKPMEDEAQTRGL